MKAGTIIVVVLMTLLVIILMQNIEIVTFKILFWEIGISRALFFLAVFIIGFLVGFIYATVTAKKKTLKNT